jgi:hypothetical protein
MASTGERAGRRSGGGARAPVVLACRPRAWLALGALESAGPVGWAVLGSRGSWTILALA